MFKQRCILSFATCAAGRHVLIDSSRTMGASLVVVLQYPSLSLPVHYIHMYLLVKCSVQNNLRHLQ